MSNTTPLAAQSGLTAKVGGLFYGGDYNPDQWDEQTWQEDMRLMKKAGVNLACFPVWNWVRIQPREGEYDWGFVDTIVEMLAANDIYLDLATPTASPPAWMSHRYPEILPVDDKGIRMAYGSRQTFCPTNATFRAFCRDISERMAQRYGKHPYLAAWHINNEYSQLVGSCHCSSCEAAFRQWLARKYGALDRVNEAWGTTFWGNTYGDWDEIISPRYTAHQHNPAQVLDYRRFISDAYLAHFTMEAEVCRQHSPGIPVTTNFLHGYRYLNYSQWAEHLDFVGVSCFPDSTPGAYPGSMTFSHTKMRGLTRGRPFVVLEQAASGVSWRDINYNMEPRAMRLKSYQALAHGSDGLCFFQWRASLSGAEKFHSAMVPHAGENTRTFRDVCELGSELKRIPEIIGSEVVARTALLYDYESLWAVEQDPRPTQLLSYGAALNAHYFALWEQNITCDMVFGTDDDMDLTRYDVLIAPVMYILQPGIEDKIRRFVESGGALVTTFCSSLVNPNDRVFRGGAPGPLADLFGLRISEYEPINPENLTRIRFNDADTFPGLPDELECQVWADIITCDTAKPLATYSTSTTAARPPLRSMTTAKGVSTTLAPCWTATLSRSSCANSPPAGA